MRTTKFMAAALFTAAILTGCGSNPAPNTNKPANTVANTTPSPEKTSNPGTPPAGITAISLTTPTEAYKTAYALRKQGDIEGLKKVMSKDALEFMTMIGEADKKTLDDMLREMVKTPQGPTDESRNEKITGNRATLEYLKDKDTWSTMDFEKEDGVWKLTMPKGDPEKKPKKQPE